MNAPVKSFERVSKEDVAFLGTDPIPATAYYDADWYELERKAVFMRSWIEIGHICELPDNGSFIRREMEFANASVLVVRGKDEKIRAFHNVCTHRGTQLVEEAQGKRATFSCRYHMWTFGGDGSLLSAPDFEEFSLKKSDCALPKISVDVCAGLIFINFDPDPQPLRAWLGDLADELEKLPVAKATTFSEYVYDIDANWKLTYDNFQENYHLRFIHPKSGAATFSPDNPYGYPMKYGFHGQHRTQTIWSNPQPRINPVQGYAMGKAYAGGMKSGIIGGENAREYFALFPNFFILGSPFPHFSHVVYPLGPTKSRGVIRLYWVGEDGSASERFGREYVLATARDVHAEDRAVIAAGQRGLSSGALKHIHFQTQEALCRHLYLEVKKSVDIWQLQQGEAA